MGWFQCLEAGRGDEEGGESAEGIGEHHEVARVAGGPEPEEGDEGGAADGAEEPVGFDLFGGAEEFGEGCEDGGDGPGEEHEEDAGYEGEASISERRLEKRSGALPAVMVSRCIWLDQRVTREWTLRWVSRRTR